MAAHNMNDTQNPRVPNLSAQEVTFTDGGELLRSIKAAFEKTFDSCAVRFKGEIQQKIFEPVRMRALIEDICQNAEGQVNTKVQCYKLMFTACKEELPLRLMPIFESIIEVELETMMRNLQEQVSGLDPQSAANCSGEETQRRLKELEKVFTLEVRQSVFSSLAAFLTNLLQHTVIGQVAAQIAAAATVGRLTGATHHLTSAMNTVITGLHLANQGGTDYRNEFAFEISGKLCDAQTVTNVVNRFRQSLGKIRQSLLHKWGARTDCGASTDTSAQTPRNDAHIEEEEQGGNVTGTSGVNEDGDQGAEASISVSLPSCERRPRLVWHDPNVHNDEARPRDANPLITHTFCLDLHTADILTLEERAIESHASRTARTRRASAKGRTPTSSA